jgi:hypothetical protein
VDNPARAIVNRLIGWRRHRLRVDERQGAAWAGGVRPRREDCPTDRRGQIAVLTDTGFEMLADAAPGHVETVRRALFDGLDPEQIKKLGEISEILAARLT